MRAIQSRWRLGIKTLTWPRSQLDIWSSLLLWMHERFQILHRYFLKKRVRVSGDAMPWNNGEGFYGLSRSCIFMSLITVKTVWYLLFYAWSVKCLNNLPHMLKSHDIYMSWMLKCLWWNMLCWGNWIYAFTWTVTMILDWPYVRMLALSVSFVN